jgi:hypothetical protein
MIISRKVWWPGYVLRMEKVINAYGILVAKPEINMFKNRSEDNIKLHLNETAC